MKREDWMSYAYGTSDWPVSLLFLFVRLSEPRHMHVDHDAMSAKFWLDPDVHLAEKHGYSRRELRVIEQLLRVNVEELRHAWDIFCHGANRTR